MNGRNLAGLIWFIVLLMFLIAEVEVAPLPPAMMTDLLAFLSSHQ